MDYELELKKQKNLQNIIFVVGIFFWPLWVLNIGRGKIIKDLEMKVFKMKIKGCKEIKIDFDRTLLISLLRSMKNDPKTFYKGKEVKEVWFDKTKLKPKYIFIYVLDEKTGA